MKDTFKTSALYNSIASASHQKRCLLAAGVALGLGGLLPGAVNAQSAEQSVNRGSYTLEEVVVTARRVGENLQDVPQTVQAVDAEMMMKLNLTDFEDIEVLVPGLSLDSDPNGFSASASMRGVSFAAESGASPTVEFYMNDAPVGTTTAFQTMFDVAQIEVLKGPQGTLRGKSSPSGAITVTTAKPNLEQVEGYVNASASDLDANNLQGAVSVPLIDGKLAVRLAGLVSGSDVNGVKSINNSVDPKKEVEAFRITTLFAPTDNLDLTLTYQNLDATTRSYMHVSGPGAKGPAGRNGPAIDAKDRLGISDGYLTSDYKGGLIIAQADWSIADHVVSYIGSFNEADSGSLSPRDSAHWVPDAEVYRTIEANGDDNKSQNHELRVSSDYKVFDLFSYTAGIFYSSQEAKTSLRDPLQTLDGAFGSPLEPLNPTSFNEDFIIPGLIGVNSEAKELSGYLNVTFDLTDKTEVSAGLRHIRPDIDRHNTLDLGDAKIAIPMPEANCAGAGGDFEGNYADVCDFPIPGTNLQDLADTVDEDTTVYNISISHHVNDDLMVYFSSGSSWRAGPSTVGFTSTLDETTEKLVLLGSEESNSYEIGMKQSFWDDRVQVNAAVYHQSFDGFFYNGEPAYYLSNADSNPVVAPFRFTSNAPATINGIDFTGSAKVTSDWMLSLGFSYADGKLDNASIPCVDTNFDGIADSGPMPSVEDFQEFGDSVAFCNSDDPISRNPKWTVNAMSEYYFGVSDTLDGYVRGVYVLKGPNDASATKVDSYGLLNLYTGLTSSDGSWELGLYAKNILDEQRILDAETDVEIGSISGMENTFGLSGYNRVARYTPRKEFGMSLNYNF